MILSIDDDAREFLLDMLSDDEDSFSSLVTYGIYDDEDIKTFAENIRHAREALEPVELVTLSQVAEHYGTVNATPINWRTRYEDFPTPVIEAGGGKRPVKLYDVAEVDAWVFAKWRLMPVNEVDKR